MADWNPYPDELRMDKGDDAAQTVAVIREFVDQLEQAFRDDDVAKALTVMTAMNQASGLSVIGLTMMQRDRQIFIENYRTQN